MSSKVKRACIVTVDCQALIMMTWLPVIQTDVHICHRQPYHHKSLHGSLQSQWQVVSYMCVRFVASRAGDWFCSGCK